MLQYGYSVALLLLAWSVVLLIGTAVLAFYARRWGRQREVLIVCSLVSLVPLVFSAITAASMYVG